MGYQVVREDEWEERTPPPGRESDPARHNADLTISAGLTQSRARLWRYPPGTRGRRLTMHLGDRAERVDLPLPEPGVAALFEDA